VRLLRAVHQWVGLAVCVVLFALGLSGAILVWEDEIMRAGNPTSQAIAPARTSAGRAADFAAIEAAVAPEKVQWIRLPRPRIGAYEAGLGHERVAVFDPRDMRLVEIREGKARAVDWLFELHIGLFFDAPGERVQGVVALFGAALAISGAILWWPARRSFRLRTLAPATMRRPHLLAAHRSIGILAAPTIALTLLLAVALCYPETIRTLMAGPPRAPAAETLVGAPGWAGAFDLLQQRLPDAEVKVIAFPRAPDKPALFRLRRPHEWQPNGRTYAEVNLTTGALVSVTDSEVRPAGERAFYAAFPLHAAKVGGLPWKLFQTFTGLALAALSLFGAVAFARKQRPAPQRTAAA
jgi:uncharacterized iron-regulated membrane protein